MEYSELRYFSREEPSAFMSPRASPAVKWVNAPAITSSNSVSPYMTCFRYPNMAKVGLETARLPWAEEPR